jgi:transcription elongation factor
LKLKSDSDTNVEKTSIGAPATRNKYAALDLVNYHGSKHGGLVLQVHEDYLKVLNEQSKIDNVKVSDVDKCIPPPRRGGNIQGQDRKGNNLVHDSMVKVVEGPYKGLIAPIKHSFKNYLFLWHKDYVQQNGIFVENQRNVEILGAEFMKPSSEAAVANQNRLVKDKLIGEEVIICGGVFKGHRGRVCKLDDK